MTRKNTIRSRNTRLSAIHSFFRFLAFREPGYGSLIQQVLAIPTKRSDQHVIEYLTDKESQALISAPDQSSWLGRRDRALLSLAIQTGLRVSELVGLMYRDIHLSHGAHVRCHGKGRKERCTPLRSDVTRILKAWVKEIGCAPNAPLFPSVRGGSLTRDGVRFLLAKYVAIAQAQCPSIKGKKVTPHVLRHTAAMMLLESGVDLVVIALWLGHESVESTQVYIHASLSIKEKTLARLDTKPVGQSRCFKPSDKLLAFLESL